MSHGRARSAVVALPLLLLVTLVPLSAAAPITYRFTFPEPEHHWMQVEAVFAELGAAPLELRAARSSPGRYSLHDFAKNVYDVEARDANGRALRVTRPDPYGWTVPVHEGSVTVRYKVFGDRVDGTYLAVDRTHAHLNMPASILWARGLEDRVSTLTFVAPSNSQWQVATQLMPGASPFEFSAPNLQYLMDSPVEFGPGAIRQFSVSGRTFRFAAHHTGTAAELEAFVGDIEKIVREEGKIFGEYPTYEPGAYTFLADYLPYASGDGMEHRNSTVISSAGSIAASRQGLLNTAAHEFFHNWNVERIRPKSIEPFDFERANLSGELWLAEGFTQYYAPLTLSRTGLAPFTATVNSFAGLIRSIAANPARDVRSPIEMSQMAPFTDGGRTVDRTNWSNTVISYYPYGGAIALALDLSLRERSNGRLTLDTFMRDLWRTYGAPGGARPGVVDHPYTLDDIETRLAAVSGDHQFAKTFFDDYIRGRRLPDYGRLVSAAGLVMRKQSPDAAWWGDVRLEVRNGVRVAATPAANSPAYKAGLDLDDEIRTIDGTAIATPNDAASAIARHKPGDRIAVEFVDRTMRPRTAMMTIEENPEVELIALEETGEKPTAAQLAFRKAWLEAQ
jgi:predicted metalloprotease with PDZ domain